MVLNGAGRDPELVSPTGTGGLAVTVIKGVNPKSSRCEGWRR